MQIHDEHGNRTGVTDRISTPSATEPPETHADWLELIALSSPARPVSLDNLTAELIRGGGQDEVGDPEDIADASDPGDEKIQGVSAAAFSEIETRSENCSFAYPFEVGPNGLSISVRNAAAPYEFLLLLSRFGHAAGPADQDGAKLFEELSAEAAREYFGGGARSRSFLFGFPRRREPAGFRDAVDQMCVALGEGGGSRDRPTQKDQKDAGLDVVVWRDFGDRRGTQLIAFGQCATGDNWKPKTTELQPDSWCDHWMKDPPAVKPIKMFFVPFWINDAHWSVTSRSAGVVFDRCRIVSLSTSIDPALNSSLEQWASFVREKHLP